MLENREAMMRLFPDLCARHRIAPVSHYPEEAARHAALVAPANCASEPVVALLTPGSYNSAYYEHFLPRRRDGGRAGRGRRSRRRRRRRLYAHDRGAEADRRALPRVDDDYLDPLTFRPDSTLGTPGLFNAYRAAISPWRMRSAPASADDKSVYRFVPEMIRFYLGETPVLNNVPTFCLRPSRRSRLRARQSARARRQGDARLGRLRHAGRPAGERERAHRLRRQAQGAARRLHRPADLGALDCPTFVESGVAPRHVDLRPFVLSGKEIHIVPGGLTRVALHEGSLVVNSSQGGGTKDTWVLEE